MKAVHIKIVLGCKRHRRRGDKYHWVRETDPSLTVCGQVIADLDVVEVIDLESLPPVEDCLACERAREGYTTRSRRASQSVVLQPSLGYSSPQHGRGSRILK